MDQDSQGEGTLGVEQNMFYPSDDDLPELSRWVMPFSHFFQRNYDSTDHTGTPVEVPRQNGLPNPDYLGLVVPWYLLPRTSVLPNVIAVTVFTVFLDFTLFS